ncbi:MAG: nucleotide pyrophosphohydrolase [Actinomycetota bacterium]|nr:nucleotide pyrophosphohydrolase [Actinomycetota bacterium]
MDPLALLQTSIREFVAERDWQKFHDPKSLLLALVGEVGELAELFQWLPAADAAEMAAQEPLRSRVGEELADVFIYLLQLADSVGIDLIPVTNEKVEAARSRFPVAEIHGIAPTKS